MSEHGLDTPILLTSNYLQTKRALCVPYAYRGADGYYLPPDPDPESARYALRLFRELAATHPALVARARLSTAGDFTPIDYASAYWEEHCADRAVEDDGYPRVLVAMRKSRA